MLKRTLILASLALLLITACATNSSGNLKRSIEVEDYQVTWSDVLVSPALQDLHSDILVNLQTQESIFMFSRFSPNNDRTIDLMEFIALAEKAVVAETSCQWLGYDRAIDAQLRARGLLASATNESLFFAKLKCNWL